MMVQRQERVLDIHSHASKPGRKWSELFFPVPEINIQSMIMTAGGRGRKGVGWSGLPSHQQGFR
jgi:hypothetical protein